MQHQLLCVRPGFHFHHEILGAEQQPDHSPRGLGQRIGIDHPQGRLHKNDDGEVPFCQTQCYLLAGQHGVYDLNLFDSIGHRVHEAAKLFAGHRVHVPLRHAGVQVIEANHHRLVVQKARVKGSAYGGPGLGFAFWRRRVLNIQHHAVSFGVCSFLDQPLYVAGNGEHGPYDPRFLV